MKKNLIAELSFAFALKVIELFKVLQKENEYVISRQLMRSGTSIGASIEEAASAFSRREFAYKHSLALREAREARYWLKLLKQSTLTTVDISTHLNDVDQIINILSRILISLKSQLEKE